MRKATRFLEQQVGRDIARLTGGRYRRVNIDDHTLDIQVWAPERGDWVPASQLSKGTIDQVFLAARIGLVRLVTQGKRPPLVLDDPFVTFDDTRAARAALLLRELSSDFQVIYLACSNRYDELADAVVELPGPIDIEPAATSPIAARTAAHGNGSTAAASPEARGVAGAQESTGLASSLLAEAHVSAAELAGDEPETGENDPDGPIQFDRAVRARRSAAGAVEGTGASNDAAGPAPEPDTAPSRAPDQP
jgi:hypothetical protein